MVEAEEKLMAKNVQNQNANVDEYSFGGRKGEADSVLMKHIALNHLMSAKSRDNHVNNRIYIHDLDSYVVGMHNCLSVPFDDLLGKGFNTRQTDVRPANSVNTAFQLVAVLFQIQSLQQFGGVSATHLDWTMVPYVRKSFLKHYIISWLTDSEEFENLDLEAMLFDDYDERIEDNGTTFIIHRNKFEDWVDENKATFFEKTGLTKEDFYLGNDKLDRKHYQRAYFDTINETQQAAEGFFHNMNSLQSRSGN
jgi:ribonucleoside-triphosphate reductase